MTRIKLSFIENTDIKSIWFEKRCKYIAKEEVEKIKKYLTPNLINIVFCVAPEDVVTTMKVWGHAIKKDLIFINIDPRWWFDSSFELQIRSCIQHELHHIQRMQKVWYWATLKEAIITEWLACKHEQELYPNLYLPYIDCNIEDIEKIKKQLPSKDIQDTRDIHTRWFFDKNEDLPKWSWYKLWYYLINIYCQKVWKKAIELVNEDFKRIKHLFEL